MEGSLGVGANLTKWPDADLAAAKQMITVYKSIRETVQNGAMYRLQTMRDGGNFSSTQYVGEDGGQTVLFAFLHSQQFGNRLPAIRLRGLNAEALYKVRRIDDKLEEPAESLSGAYLMNHGISLHLMGDYDSTLLVLEKAR